MNHPNTLYGYGQNFFIPHISTSELTPFCSDKFPKNLPKTFKMLPKRQHCAKFGHTLINIRKKGACKVCFRGLLTRELLQSKMLYRYLLCDGNRHCTSLALQVETQLLLYRFTVTRNPNR